MVFKGLIAALAALALSLPVALAADPVRVAPGQRVDLKVLLLSADGTRAGLRRLEGARSSAKACPTTPSSPTRADRAAT